jgi:tetratricopeptide (TPR) repeat protein
MLEWDDCPAPSIVMQQRQEAAAPMIQDDNDPRSYDSMRRKIRDRYVCTRFPGVATCSSDLEAAERMVKAARLYFEEERNDQALELLELAIEECPRESALWLARLEILFLLRDAGGYAETARDFHREHPGAEEVWAEICRLGRALAPGEALFGSRKGPRDHEHYGPWPHTPNWIQAPWDLTAEIIAADFHRAVSQLAPRSGPAPRSAPWGPAPRRAA